jgi:formylglycine-generating enzyme required for sulfatase activity
MKTKSQCVSVVLALLAFCTLNSQLSSVLAQGTAFTYQGQLISGGSPANGSFDLTFTLFATEAGRISVAGTTPVTNAATEISNGLFNVTLDFGEGIFMGGSYWLQIGVRTNGASAFTALTPRQAITPAPYALYAPNAGAAASAYSVAAGGSIPVSALPGVVLTNGATGVSLSGAFSGDGSGLISLPAAVVTNGATGVTLSGTFSGNGEALTNLSAAQLTGSSLATPPASGAPILNMVWIVPGTFIMGAPTSDPDYVSDETQHVVTLTNGFWMGQHPVTQGEYLAVIGSNPSYFTGDLSRPVEQVTWINATNFCNTLTQNEQSAGRLPSGWVYRLPTESEWEYCCRALTTTRFYFGNDPGDGASLTNYAWYSVNSGSKTQPVGQLLPNAWGLVDMAGNVWEWCQDWYGTYPTGNVSYNPQGPASGSNRVYRGGSWFNPADLCRSSSRLSRDPTLEAYVLGFRVVLAPGQ